MCEDQARPYLSISSTTAQGYSVKVTWFCVVLLLVLFAGRECVPACILKTRGELAGVGFLLLCGPGERTQDVGCDSTHLYQLNHIAGLRGFVSIEHLYTCLGYVQAVSLMVVCLVHAYELKVIEEHGNSEAPSLLPG